MPVLTSGNADGVPYFTMPFVEGELVDPRPCVASGRDDRVLRIDMCSIECYTSDMPKRVAASTPRVFKTKWFTRAARSALIPDNELCVAVAEVAQGQGNALWGGVSQPIFARRIYVSPSTVAKWESGANKPSGIALKYLNVLKRLGAEALD